jgi:hypothetical protein
MEAIIRVFLAIVFVAVSLVPVSAGEPIERSFAKLKLGMTIEDFSKQYPAQERTDTFLNLASGERFFEVSGVKFPENVAALVGKFLNNRLYRISAEYTKEFADRTSWEALLTKTAKKYGHVAVQSGSQGEKVVEVARWDDGTTTMILQREGKPRFESQKLKMVFTFSVAYLDDALWNERLAMEQEMF